MKISKSSEDEYYIPSFNPLGLRNVPGSNMLSEFNAGIYRSIQNSITNYVDLPNGWFVSSVRSNNTRFNITISVDGDKSFLLSSAHPDKIFNYIGVWYEEYLVDIPAVLLEVKKVLDSSYLGNNNGI